MAETEKNPALCKQLEAKSKDRPPFLNAEQLKYAYRGLFEKCAVAGKVFYNFIESQIEIAILKFRFNKDQVNRYRKEVDRQIEYIFNKYLPADNKVTKSLFHRIIWKQAPHNVLSNASINEDMTYDENPGEDDKVNYVVSSVSNLNRDFDGICHDQRTSMLKVIGDLDKDSQHIIYWKFWEGMTLTEIGNKLGLAHNTILKRLNKLYPMLGDKFIEIDERKAEGA